VLRGEEGIRRAAGRAARAASRRSRVVSRATSVAQERGPYRTSINSSQNKPPTGSGGLDLKMRRIPITGFKVEI
jgi:hypothetical protein